MNMEQIVRTIREMRNTTPDAVAVKSKELYPQFPIGQAVTQEMIDKGANRFVWNKNLYRVPKPITKILDNWTPDLAPALYEAINETHAGTKEDPIPFVVNMQVFKDKYYIYSNILYICIRDSGIPLQYTPDQLIDHYFKLA